MLIIFIVFTLLFEPSIELEPEDGIETEDENDFERGGSNLGLRVKNWKPGDLENPEFLGTYAEGDILFPHSLTRMGLISEAKRWYHGQVPYEFSRTFWFYERFMLWRAMAAYHKETCIRFVERSSENSDYIIFVGNDHGCYSSVGRVGGRQKVNIQTPNCLRSGTIIHELMHVAGFAHEHSRYDREEYISVIYQNIYPNMTGQFKTCSRAEYTDFGETYDYRSIMHYSAYAFTKNNRVTMVPLDGRSKLGLAEYFSPKDVRKLNKMYKCNGTAPRASIWLLTALGGVYTINIYIYDSYL